LIHDFEVGTRMDTLAEPKEGLTTANNNRFLRIWFEVAYENISFNSKTISESVNSGCKWFPYSKGGAYRKWFGNYDFVVNWENNGKEIRNFTGATNKIRSHNYNLDYIFRRGLTWSTLTSGNFSVRYRTTGSIHDTTGVTAFATKNSDIFYLLGILNTKVADYILKIINPTISLKPGYFSIFPVLKSTNFDRRIVDNSIYLAKLDWDSFENSWDFTTHPLLTHIADDNLSHCRSPVG